MDGMACKQGVDFVVAKGVVEGLREGHLAESLTDVAGVPGLDGEDGASGRESVLGHDVGGGTGVGADTNA